jgi:transcriptional regulator with XRE-family HTH domain
MMVKEYGVESQPQQQRLRELGDFLRKRRSRLAPEDVGFSRGNRRQTTGLRREEVALLMGVSTEWYTWLEQGRPINTSTQVLESLVRALLLDVDERAYLFFLAHQQPPPDIATTVETVSPSLQHYLDHLGNSPAYVTGKYWDIVAWNDAARITFLDYPLLENSRDRNILWHFFTWPSSQEIMVNREQLARWLVAAFRISYGRYFGNTQMTTLVQDLMIHETLPTHAREY